MPLLDGLDARRSLPDGDEDRKLLSDEELGIDPYWTPGAGGSPVEVGDGSGTWSWPRGTLGLLR